MGGAVSAGENNDELIDNLIEGKYIKSKQIENVFRSVDRGNFYLLGHKDTAYHDLAWKHEHLHISAPCIYSQVMTSLQLCDGLSFLNIGSGTGYLSTMAGLVLGPFGINHGIELHDDVVDYARQRVEEFITQSHAFDRYTFCEPEFIVGNCLHLSPDMAGYDRVYCGAACPSTYESFMKNLLNIGGILVMPLNDQLQVIKRVDQTKWEISKVLAVNFASLIVPNEDEDASNQPCLPNRNPPSLRFICRACIRKTLSCKYHKGTLRYYKKRKFLPEESTSYEEQTSSSDNASNKDLDLTQASDTDSDDPTKDSPLSKIRRHSSLLNVATGTVTDVVDEESPSSSGNPPKDAEKGKKLSKSSAKQDGDSQNEERKRSNKKSKGKNGSSNGKLKRTKRGCYPFFRRRHKNRNSEEAGEQKEVTTPSQQENTSEPSTNTTHRERSLAAYRRGRTYLRFEESTRAENGERTTSYDVHVGPDSATSLRTFLVGCANRNPTAMRASDLFSIITDRAMRRINTSSSSSSDDEGEDRREKRSKEFEKEENPSYQLFCDAVCQLPVPESIKGYLLYYRER